MEKWWNVTFCWGLFHIQARGSEDETDGNTFDNFYHTGFIFHAQSYFFALKQLSAEAMLSGMSLGGIFGFDGRPAVSPVKRRRRERQNIITAQISPQLSTWSHSRVAKTSNPPQLCSLSRGERFLHDMTNEVNFSPNKEMCLSFFVEEDERDRHREWNGIIENTPRPRHAFSLKSGPLVIWMKRASRRINGSAAR